jgi:organic radical activating enzyme
MSVDSIVERVREYKSKFVVLTGGEPTIQSLENLEELVWRLHLLGYFVAIETNGTNVIDRKRLAFNWITVSPKSHDFQQRTGNELKLLYDGSQDLLYYESVGQFEFYYLQPILPERDLRYYQEDPDALVRFMRSVHKAVGVCVQAAITYPRWRVSFQSHKIVGVR